MFAAESGLDQTSRPVRSGEDVLVAPDPPPSHRRDFRPPEAPAAAAPPEVGGCAWPLTDPPPPCPALEAAETSPLPALGGAREPFLMFLKGDQVRSNLLQERPREAPSEPASPSWGMPRGRAASRGSGQTQGGDNLKGLQKVAGDLKRSFPKGRERLGPSPLGLGKPLAQATSPAPVLHFCQFCSCTPRKPLWGPRGQEGLSLLGGQEAEAGTLPPSTP